MNLFLRNTHVIRHDVDGKFLVVQRASSTGLRSVFPREADRSFAEQIRIGGPFHNLTDADLIGELGAVKEEIAEADRTEIPAAHSAAELVRLS